jgi:hypothetical protein
MDETAFGPGWPRPVLVSGRWRRHEISTEGGSSWVIAGGAFLSAEGQVLAVAGVSARRRSLAGGARTGAGDRCVVPARAAVLLSKR